MSNSYTKQRSQIPRPAVCNSPPPASRVGGTLSVVTDPQTIHVHDIVNWIVSACKSSLPEGELVTIAIDVLSGPFTEIDNTFPGNCTGQIGSASGTTSDVPSTTFLKFTATWSDGSSTSYIATVETIE